MVWSFYVVLRCIFRRKDFVGCGITASCRTHKRAKRWLLVAEAWPLMK